jgi:hypothetical protein
MTTEDPPPQPVLREVKWIFPKDLEEGQPIAIHVQGSAVCPYFDYHADGRPNGSRFYQGIVQRISDENGDLIAVQIGYYRIPDFLLDHPRVTAVIEE